MGWMPAARRIESSRSVVARASSTDASRLRLGSVPFGSVRFGSVRSFAARRLGRVRDEKCAITHQSSRRSVRARRVACVVCDSPCVTHRVGVGVVVVCDSPLRTRAYGMVGVGRSSCLNAMEKEKVHIGRSNGYRRVASRAR